MDQARVDTVFKLRDYRSFLALQISTVGLLRIIVHSIDTSYTGIEAVLSQHSEKRLKMHPVAFFSRKLCPAERNYDVRNQKLLAVKLPMEEWKHWLEGPLATLFSLY